MTLTFAAQDDTTLPLYTLEESQLDGWLQKQTPAVQSWVQASGFTAGLGSALIVPGNNGTPGMALAGFGSPKSRARSRFYLAAALQNLPKGSYCLTGALPASTVDIEALGALLTGYKFTRYAGTPKDGARLTAPDDATANRLETMAASEALIRDLVNTPASDMGPSNLEAACTDLAQEFDANIEITRGDDLLQRNLPMIHAVGRAAADEPRLIDMRWGKSGPKLTLVGKGVCFDTGGLNLKPGASMGLMKKDMGGAANVLGLARNIMALGLNLQLRVLVPAVENAVSGNAFRPGDILTSRKGLTVEINNTDAEGRLVLADALALADEEKPDMIVSMATLTGAARVAVGPDLAPFYTDDDTAAAALANAAVTQADPVWRMPFWTPYEADIEPGIADLDNAPKGGFAGSITAALFLRRFVTDTARYMHFDIYSWQASAAPARSKGGFGQGGRALLDALPSILSL